MARTTSTRVEGSCVSARRRGRGSSDIRRERSARPPKEAFTRKKGGADERVTRTGTESGVSYVINLGHRHGPCIAHLVPLNVLWAHGPRSVSYATLLSQIGSTVFASSKKNRAAQTSRWTRYRLLWRCERFCCKQANQSRSHPLMSVSPNLFLWRARRSPGAFGRYTSTLCGQRVLYVVVLCVRRKPLCCYACAALPHFQHVDESRRIAESKNIGRRGTAFKYF